MRRRPYRGTFGALLLLATALTLLTRTQAGENKEHKEQNKEKEEKQNANKQRGGGWSAMRHATRYSSFSPIFDFM